MKLLFFFSIFLFLFPPHAHANVQSAKLSVDVDAGQWKSVRLKNLPRNATVKVDVRSDRAVIAALITEEQYKQYPGISRPLFQGAVAGKLSFTVKITAAGNYHLVFDNTAGSRTVKVDAAIAGASGADADLLQGDRRTVEGDNISKDLTTIGAEVGKIFIFKPFAITAKRCGKAESFSGSDGIVLCLEFVKAISDTMGDKEKASTALLFATYHEVGHVLLSQWGYPFYDNEEIADEFAAMLFVMAGQGERLTTWTEYFLSNPAPSELLAKAFQGDRHPLSLERARNIVQWVKDTGRLKRWQVIFVPRMQTALLERIKKSPPSWADAALVKKELILRKQTVF